MNDLLFTNLFTSQQLASHNTLAETLVAGGLGQNTHLDAFETALSVTGEHDEAIQDVLKGFRGALSLDEQRAYLLMAGEWIRAQAPKLQKTTHFLRTHFTPPEQVTGEIAHILKAKPSEKTSLHATSALGAATFIHRPITSSVAAQILAGADGIGAASADFRLRSYQTETKDKTVRHYLDGHDRGLIVLPTGAGKTVTFAAIAAEVAGKFKTETEITDPKLAILRDKKILILTHRQEIFDQTVIKMREIFGKDAVTTVQSGDNKDTSGKVVVAMIPTLAAMDETTLKKFFNPEEFGLLVVDEVHHVMANTWMKTLGHFGFVDRFKNITPVQNRFLVGVTATPDRTDGKHLSELFGVEGLILSRSISWFVEEGWLLRPLGVHINARIKSDPRKIKISATTGDFDEKSLADYVDVPARNNLVVDTWAERARDKKTIIFAASVPHAIHLAELFNLKHPGLNAAVVHSGMSKDERKQVIADFKAGKIRVLTNFGILTEGFDDPGIECVVNTRPTQSRSLYVQMVGRGLRPDSAHPEIKSCLILDFTDSIDGDPFQMNLAEMFGVKYREYGIDFDPIEAIAKLKRKKLGRKGADIEDVTIEGADANFVNPLETQPELGRYLQSVLHEKYEGDITTFAWAILLKEDALTRYLYHDIPDTEKELLTLFAHGIENKILDSEILKKMWQKDLHKRWYSKTLEAAVQLHQEIPEKDLVGFMLALAERVDHSLDILFEKQQEAGQLGIDTSRLSEIFALHVSEAYTQEMARADYEKLLDLATKSRLPAEKLMHQVSITEGAFHFHNAFNLMRYSPALLVEIFKSRGINVDALDQAFRNAINATLLWGAPPHIEALARAMQTADTATGKGNYEVFCAKFFGTIGFLPRRKTCNPDFARDNLHSYIKDINDPIGKVKFNEILADTLMVFSDHPLVETIMEIVERRKFAIHFRILRLRTLFQTASGDIVTRAFFYSRRGTTLAQFQQAYKEHIVPIYNKTAKDALEFNIKNIHPFLPVERIAVSHVADRFLKAILGAMEVEAGFTVDVYQGKVLEALGLSAEEYHEWCHFFEDQKIDLEVSVLSALAQKMHALSPEQFILGAGKRLSSADLQKLPRYDLYHQALGLDKMMPAQECRRWTELFEERKVPSPFTLQKDDHDTFFAIWLARFDAIYAPRSFSQAMAKMVEITGLSETECQEWFDKTDRKLILEKWKRGEIYLKRADLDEELKRKHGYVVDTYSVARDFLRATFQRNMGASTEEARMVLETKFHMKAEDIFKYFQDLEKIDPSFAEREDWILIQRLWKATLQDRALIFVERLRLAQQKLDHLLKTYRQSPTLEDNRQQTQYLLFDYTGVSYSRALEVVQEFEESGMDMGEARLLLAGLA
ncbi:MAG: DEAD/DEAH box helicase, partial [Deltaproteobacteria bacterium]|nr:DEAD/DEAH box helicase [Deltaproteobacteria bacterium]